MRKLLVEGKIDGFKHNEFMRKIDKIGRNDDIPDFSLKAGHFNGYPVIEVLKNDGPIHIWDEHFRFGVRKAQILIACTDVLRDFWRSDKAERLKFETHVIESRRYHPPARVRVEMHPNFERSTGDLVDRPYLRLQALPPDDGRISVGVMKCRAIFAVKQGLQRWLRQQGVPD